MAHPDSLAATLGLLPDSLKNIFGLTSIASLANPVWQSSASSISLQCECRFVHGYLQPMKIWLCDQYMSSAMS